MGSKKVPQTSTPRSKPTLLFLAVVLGFFVIAQIVGQFGQARSIRYDEFKHYVREGRVEWINLHVDEIRGAFHRNQIPRQGATPDETSTPSSRDIHFVTGRLDDDSLIPLLEEHAVAFRAIPESGLSWSSVFLFVFPLVLMLSVFGGLFRGMAGRAGGLLSFSRSKGKVFQEDDVSIAFSDVAGVEEAKEELQEIIEFLKRPERYRAIGAKIPKGVLLVGPPGTGKTLLARAVAGEAKVPFISINGSEFVEMFVGVGAARVRDLFEQAERSAPCIVFIDELDAIGRSRTGVGTGAGAHEEREQTLNQLLVELDGFEPKKAVIIMSATNRPEILDPALLRPGRFDRQILVDRPDRKGRTEILQVHTRSVQLDGDVELDSVAARTPGFAGADLANLVNESALLAARRGRKTVSKAEFSDAIDRVVAGLQKKGRLIADHERKRIAYHEVGHALASVLAGSEEHVHKISIVPRGMSALGFTMQMPTRDRYLVTESELHTKLVGLLGGRAAEELVFGESSTGSQNDLEKATEIATAMVADFGMSKEVGLVSVRREPRGMLLQGVSGPLLRAHHDAGGRLADTVDEEVRSLVWAAYDRARALLGAQRPMLDRIAGRLMEAEQLEGEELEALLSEALRCRVVDSPRPQELGVS